MKRLWHGDIQIDGQTNLEGLLGHLATLLSPAALALIHMADINLTAVDPVDLSAQCIPSDSTLRFLSVVVTSQIPLYMVFGSKFAVTTSQVTTQTWFNSILRSGDSDFLTSREWLSAIPTLPLGILVSVDRRCSAVEDDHHPKVTELLFFASADDQHFQALRTHPSASNGVETRQPNLKLFALPLSSDILSQIPADELTPPASPTTSTIQPTFLPVTGPTLVKPQDIINRPPVRKRKSATEAFDEAAERRHKARRIGGQGVAAAAASMPKRENSLPTLAHRRSLSNTQIGPLQPKSLSRSPSIASTRPASAREASVPANARRSTLSRVQSVPNVAESTESSIDSRNRETISKVVMAGMRLFGLSQSKPRKPKLSIVAVTEARPDRVEYDNGKDDEFKLTYHQVFKATCFAFRRHMDTLNLQARSDALRETVDRLLGVFCTDPLADGPGPDSDTFPGASESFGTAARPMALGRDKVQQLQSQCDKRVTAVFQS